MASIDTPAIVLRQSTWPSGTPAVSVTALFKVLVVLRTCHLLHCYVSRCNINCHYCNSASPTYVAEWCSDSVTCCTVILLVVVASIATPPIVLLQHTWPSSTPAVSATALFKVHFNCSNSASLAYLP